jgi:hypothetical protein
MPHAPLRQSDARTRQAGGPVVGWGRDASKEASAVAIGRDHICAIQAGDGAVISWGRDEVGAATPPDAVTGVADTTIALAAGGATSCAIRSETHAVVC